MYAEITGFAMHMISLINSTDEARVQYLLEDNLLSLPCNPATGVSSKLRRAV